MNETLAQYQWRFRNHALAGAQDHSIGLSPVNHALERLNLTPDFFPLGPDVPINLADDVPEGTVVYVGDPDKPGHLGVFRRQGRGWMWVFGVINYPEPTVTVAVLPGVDHPPDWVTAKASKHEDLLIKRFKARAFQVGQRTRAQASWCGAYDDVMRRIGVTAQEVQGVSGGIVGDTPNQSDTAAMPEGTMLAWLDPENPARWAVYQRVGTAQNTTRTQRVHGNRLEGSPLNNWRAGCRVIWMPEFSDNTDWDWQIHGAHTLVFLESCPQDTRFTYGSRAYRKVSDTHAVADGSTAQTQIQQFVNLPIIINGFGDAS